MLLKQKNLKDKLTGFEYCQNQATDLQELLELALLEKDESLLQTIGNDIDLLEQKVEELKVKSLLSGEFDSYNCFLELHSGAGGVEAQDWCLMLLRMYTKYCDKQGFKHQIISQQDGDEAGLKSVTLKITGSFAYGYLVKESGVHRLVRISPFDSSARRHTSFASVYVYPEIEKDINIKLEDKDLRIDTYRASGAGGQHVNTTDSAVRITHIPTSLVVQCQSDRSQHKNKEHALKMLKAKLYELELQNQSNKAEKQYSEKNSIGFGSQIRSYVLHPYQMVKDLRTNLESYDPQGVLDGDIENFIKEALIKGL